MALSDLYASTIIKTDASFGFSNFECDPNDISTALKIEPDEIRRKGEKRHLRNGRELNTPFNSWAIISKGTSKDVNDHLRELLLRLSGREKFIEQRFGTPHFGVLWKGNYLYAGSGPFYESDVLVGIACFRAELYQDIYQIDQPDDERNARDDG